MTVSSDTSKHSYDGDGSTVEFPVDFKFVSNSDVTAILRAADGTETTWTYGTHYTLTGAGEDDGGTLTVETSPTDYTPANGERLVIKRTPPEVQASGMPLGGSFPSTVVEAALDYLTMLVQTHSEELARAMKLPDTASASTTLPDIETNGGLLLRINAAGTGLEAVSLATLDETTLTTPIGLDDGGTAADLSSVSGNEFIRVNSGGTALGTFKNNFSATAAPTVGDDSEDGYEVGSLWVDTTNNAVYICLNASIGAAVWRGFGWMPVSSTTISSSTDYVEFEVEAGFEYRVRGYGITHSEGAGAALAWQTREAAAWVTGTTAYQYGGHTYDQTTWTSDTSDALAEVTDEDTENIQEFELLFRMAGSSTYLTTCRGHVQYEGATVLIGAQSTSLRNAAAAATDIRLFMGTTSSNGQTETFESGLFIVERRPIVES